MQAHTLGVMVILVAAQFNSSVAEMYVATIIIILHV
jgi:hypothetical protein